MAATLTQAQTIRNDATFQGRLRVEFAKQVAAVLADVNQSQRNRQLAYQVITHLDQYMTQMLDYASSRYDVLNTTEAGTTDGNITTIVGAGLVVLFTSV